MAKDNQILVRVNDPTNESVEEFADDRDLNKAEAVRKIVESRLKGEGYLQRHYENDAEPIPDGGRIMEKLDGIEKQVSTNKSETPEIEGVDGDKSGDESGVIHVGRDTGKELVRAKHGMTDTDPFLFITFVLTLIIALGVFNVI